MKIATYNIWNSDIGMPQREQQIIDEITILNTDFIVLQEVKNKAYFENLVLKTKYEFSCFEAHEDEEEGLAILSKYPIKATKYIDSALIATVEHLGHSMIIVNVHLPWNGVLAKENCIVNVIDEISPMSSDYRFILGDFNCSEGSSVYEYVSGKISLSGTEAKPYWTDLAFVAEEFLGVKKEMTLNLSTNPRWKGQSITDHSSRVDCIFIHDCFPRAYPSLKSHSYFGKNVDERTGMCPSDHYGVLAELVMPYESIK